MTDATGSDRAESPPRGYQASGGLVPVPDPTLLTTQNLLREIAALRELLQTQIKAVELRVDRNDALIAKHGAEIESGTDHLRRFLEEKIAKLDAVCLEKFTGVAAQFSERDTRTDQRAGDTKLAVDAAFAAAKEATAKIEAGFTKQIDGMTQIIDTKTRNIEGNLSDLKERMTAIESRSGTTVDVRRDSREDSRNVMSAISIVVALAAVAAVVIIGLVKH